MKELLRELREANIKVNINGEDLEISTSDNSTISPTILTKLRGAKQELLDFLKASSSVNNFKNIPLASIQDDYPLSSSQYRIWVTVQGEQSSLAYNMPGAVQFQGKLDRENFFKAIDYLIRRHEILRTVFRENSEGEIRQVIIAPAVFDFSPKFDDLRTDAHKAGKVSTIIAASTRTIFELERGPLLKMHLLQLTDESYLFVYNIHHIIGDAWSMELITKEILMVYETLIGYVWCCLVLGIMSTARPPKTAIPAGSWMQNRPISIVAGG